MKSASTGKNAGTCGMRIEVEHVLDELDDVAFVTDMQDRIRKANGHAIRALGFEEAEFLGRRVGDFAILAEAIPMSGAGAGAVNGSAAHYRRKTGSLFTARRTDLPISGETGQPCRLALLREVTDDGQFAHVIHALYDISSSHELSSEDKIRRILQLGCRVFGLPTGIVSMVENTRYTIAHAYSTEFDLYPGAEFAVEDTYCCHTLQAEGPTCFHRASEQGLATHPCFQKMGLEGYIGVPLTVEGQIFGTLNFSGLKPRPRFRNMDLELSKLVAAWVSQELGFTKAVTALQELAEADPLTGRLNRRGFEQVAQDILVSHRQTRQPAALVLVDIDNFKDINDRHGHGSGDAVLVALAEACNGTFRASDPVGRIGGDEFAVLLDGADTEDGLAVIAKFQERIRTARVQGQDGPLHFSVSCGLASLGPETGGLQEWFCQADAALYEAKDAGRDTCRAHTGAGTYTRQK